MWSKQFGLRAMWKKLRDFIRRKKWTLLFILYPTFNHIISEKTQKSGNTALGSVGEETFNNFKQTYIDFMENVLGVREEEEHKQELNNGVVTVLINLRKKARVDKNFALSDKIRDDLKAIGVQLMDGKDGEIGYTIE